jgi:hypothetical protein
VKYWQPSAKKWGWDRWGEKEYTFHSGDFAATVVIVPMDKQREDPKEGEDPTYTIFPMFGVRIEDTRTRKEKDGYEVPGYCYFVKNKTEMVSETGPWAFKTDMCGGIYLTGGYPEMKRPTVKYKGEPMEKHRLRSVLEPLVESAKEKYEEWLEEKRAV